MAQYEMKLVVNVDEELLADHDGEEKPPPNDILDWYGGDLVAALDAGIAEIEHDQIQGITEIEDE